MAYGLTKSAHLVTGSDQYLSIANNSTILPTGNFTVEGWFKFNSTGELILFQSGNDDSSKNWQMLYNAGTLVCDIYSNGHGSEKVGSVSWTPSTATWYHIAFVYDTGGNVKFYVNGAQQGSTVTGYPTTVSQLTTNPFKIGGYLPSSSIDFDGNVSLCRIWTTNLSGATLAANSCTVYGSAQSNMAAEWSLDNVLTDASGNGNTLTNNNTATFTTDTPGVCNPSVPTVTTQAVSAIASATATANGNITADGGSTLDKKGVVYSTTTHSDPGNVAPASTSYESNVIETGSFSTGAFIESLTSLTRVTTYYVRAFAHNSTGYSYGSEVSFTTYAVDITQLVVGAGGAGGEGSNENWTGGGGGGGDVKPGTSSVAITSYSITIGAGGTSDDVRGGDTTFNSVTALGGGRGEGIAGALGYLVSGEPGGSGGGGSIYNGFSTGVGGGTSGTNVHSGGDSTTNKGGGGGGASAGGSNGASTSAGGEGYTSSISGAAIVYGSGGGGGRISFDGTGAAPGGTNAGSGAVGAVGAFPQVPATNPTNNTGAGGGGRMAYAGNSYGADGVVIISVPVNTITATGGTHTVAGGNDIWTFTTSGTWTPSLPTAYSLTAVQGAYSLTGNAVTFSTAHGAIMSVVTGYYSLVGYSVAFELSHKWTPLSKSSSTWTPFSKNISTWQPKSKNDVSYTALNKSAASTWGQTNKSSSTWTATNKS